MITLKNISKYYKKNLALDQISLQIKTNQIYGFIGPDGAGKSSLMYIIAGICKPSSGTVQVLGENVLKHPEIIKKQIGFMPQGLGLTLSQELTVEENINYFGAINLVPKDQLEIRKKELLAVTQLTPFTNRPAKNLSGGMQQKLALCCTVIHSPKLILLDEPTTGVDPISRNDIWGLINKMVKKEKTTFLITTSYMDEATHCHQIALFNKGKIISQGSPEKLLVSLQNKVASIQDEDDHLLKQQLSKIPQIKIVYPMGTSLHAIFEAPSIEDLRDVLKSKKIIFTNLELSQPHMEDLFLYQIANQKESQLDEILFDEFFPKQDSEIKKTVKKDGSVIEVKKLEKKFDSFSAVDKITFNIKRGEIFGFLGPNGAGKTTTIKMLCGLIEPTSGQGSILGLDLFKDTFRIKQKIGYMSQHFSLYQDLSVMENIELYGGIYGVKHQELKRRKQLILKLADLEGKGQILTRELSLGIKQRLALGCAIIHQPELLFLDEPTSGVDPIARRKFWDLIFLLSRKIGVSILVSTHHMDEAEYCDRLLLINKGQIIGLGSADELRTKVTVDVIPATLHSFEEVFIYYCKMSGQNGVFVK